MTDRPSGGGPAAGTSLLGGWRRGAALGVRAAIAPAIVYVSLGWLLGPGGFVVLSPGALRHLDLVISLALAVLGVFAGLGLDLRGRDDRRLLVAATAEALVTIAVVSSATAWLARMWALPVVNATASVPLLLGVCAAASAVVTQTGSLAGEHAGAWRISDLDDVAVIVLGAGVLSWPAGVSLADAAWKAALAIPLGATIAGAGGLLFERARSEAERGTFVLGVLTLLAGTAAYLALSPLLTGMVAGLLWRWAPGRADEIIRADLEKLHHPLVVLLLVIAGTAVTWSRLAIWLLVPYVLFRLAGKLVGARTSAWMFGGATDVGELAARLLPSGLLGIALALQFNQLADGPIGAAVVSSVAIGAIGFDLMTLGALSGERR